MLEPIQIEKLNKTMNEILTKMNATQNPKNSISKSIFNKQPGNSILQWIDNGERMLNSFGNGGRFDPEKYKIKPSIANQSGWLKALFTGNSSKFDIAEYKNALKKASAIIEWEDAPAFTMQDRAAVDPINIKQVQDHEDLWNQQALEGAKVEVEPLRSEYQVNKMTAKEVEQDPGLVSTDTNHPINIPDHTGMILKEGVHTADIPPLAYENVNIKTFKQNNDLEGTKWKYVKKGSKKTKKKTVKKTIASVPKDAVKLFPTSDHYLLGTDGNIYSKKGKKLNVWSNGKYYFEKYDGKKTMTVDEVEALKKIITG